MSKARYTKTQLQRTPRNDGKPWSNDEYSLLRTELRDGMTTDAIAKKLKRTPEAVRKHALRRRISLITGRLKRR